MASNLKCNECKSLFIQPRILPCRHSICYLCAVQLLRNNSKPNANRAVGSSVDNIGEDTSDSVSVSSETDSGVFVNGSAISHDRNSRRYSSSALQSQQPTCCVIKCPVCQYELVADEQVLRDLPQNYEVAEKVKIFLTNSIPLAKCQLCADKEVALEATIFCEQCKVYYCSKCKDTSHPTRGPFLTHNVVSAHHWFLATLKNVPGAKCVMHSTQSVTYYCLDCTRLICVQCLEDESHSKHDVQAISAATKILKVSSISRLENMFYNKPNCAKFERK
ncbi:E3 ubiquitin-protein ligase TRIM9-like [Convolutriloba macropyga]|uniref:E3 ubiquitin-protein ligase TRIM9-like n=1 Tax=Convolutriloba macropyga TaxID=536237 RepID=UPI003F51F85A